LNSKVGILARNWMESYLDMGGPDSWIKISAKIYQEKLR